MYLFVSQQTPTISRKIRENSFPDFIKNEFSGL